MNLLKEGKTNWKYILIVVILVVIVGGGTLTYQYWWVPKGEVKISEVKPLEEVTKDETADWNAYRNEEYGFEFKYPSTYFLKDRLANEEKAVLVGDKEFPRPDIAPWYHSPISIEPTNETRNTAMINSLVDKTTSSIKVSGVSADIIEGKYASYPGFPSIYRARLIIIPEKELTIWIREFYADEISDWNTILTTTTKILSTFRFIETDETVNWKIYSNPEANFTFRYPRDWEIISEYFYETLAGIKAGKLTVTLGKDGKEKISINLRQAQCSSPCKCQEITGNIIQTCSKDPGVVKIFNQMLSTFRFIEKEITSFEKCVVKRKEIGGLSRSSFCECNMPDGKVFIKQTENVEDLTTKYTDEEFGFSFYYPKSFELSKSHPRIKWGDIYLTKVGPFEDTIIITKYAGQRVENSDAKFGEVAYYYDEDKEQWMKDINTDFQSGISPAEPRFYTVSGLSVFLGVGRWATEIVALSTDKFLIINITGSGWTTVLDPLTKTVIKIDQKIDEEKLNNALKEEICSLEW